MKIYTKLRIDINTGRILQKEAFEYQGPIASLGGAGGMISSVMPYLTAASTAYDLASPKGPIASGDFGGALKGLSNLGGSFEKINSAGTQVMPTPTPAPSPMTDSLNAQHGTIDIEQFKTLSPEMQKELLMALTRGKAF
jgi:hypothetical protein